MSLGIYIQVPFCQTKCTYCNFHTGVVSPARFAPYASAVQTEIREHRQRLAAGGIALPESFAALTVDTVYFGGGTPSLLDPAHLAAILETMRSTLRTDFLEATLEADPETVEPSKAEAWSRAGINRVSLGVQSFSDVELTAAGRIHRRADVYRAVPILRGAGISNISFDLIAGLPRQTPETWQNSLDELIQLGPEHVSVYLLEVDEDSRLGSELLRGGAKYSASAVPSDDVMAECYDLGRVQLRRAGFEQYEISNFAKPGFASRHNRKYWCREPYLGFGAGAHSFSGTQRWANAHDAAAYVQTIATGSIPVRDLESISAKQALEEELFLGLRQLEGIDLSRLERQYGTLLESRFARLQAAGLIERSGPVVRLVAERLSISTEAFVELMR
ncbi:MAG TPA: radical SAM family heme chaperone HemW [Candidatus Eisenbacteria bacterium]|jgi:oxygen-independent coproporphyrinogen-3 oxidase|nr:radical SAM family heme chaperone HemW [Candidatus Eisenbacteria bacterium]